MTAHSARGSLHATILSHDARIFDGDVVSVVAPGELGSMGILLNHAPLVTTLTPGKISLRGEAAGKTVIRSSGKGFLEVFKNTVTILIDSAEVDRPNIPS